MSCSAISLSATGNGELVADVSGNVVQQSGGTPLHVAATQGGARLSLTATANLFREGNPTGPAIRVQSGATSSDTTRVCADLGGPGARANKIEGAWDTNGAIHVIHRFGSAIFELAGLSGGTGDAAAAAALAARNGGIKVRAVLRPESIEKGFQPAQGCATPELTQ